jgi:hypothetical protein
MLSSVLHMLHTTGSISDLKTLNMIIFAGFFVPGSVVLASV